MADLQNVSRVDMQAYRSSPREIARVKHLLSLLPDDASEVLEIGARDFFVSRQLAQRRPRIVTLDLDSPGPETNNIEPVIGSINDIPFGNGSFHTVLCTEVLEHIPPGLLERSCSELIRVARERIVVGVPFEQDIRIGRTTCPHCGTRNPPWGHVNTFDRAKLLQLFEPLRCVSEKYVGEKKKITNALSVWILDALGNPGGMYNQEEPCVACGEKLYTPSFGPAKLAAAKLARLPIRAQSILSPAKPIWIHLAFEKQKSVPGTA